MDNRPIGIFDSGLGGLTGLKALRELLPEDLEPILSGLLLQYISYNTLFPYAIFFTVCALITMSQVKHGDAKPVPKKSALENFDVDD